MIISYSTDLQNSIHSKLAAGHRLTPAELIPNAYSYDHSGQDIRLLHLMGGGSIRLTVPFNTSISFDSALLLIYVCRGGVHAHIHGTEDSFDLASEEFLLLPPGNALTLQSWLLPTDCRIFVIAGQLTEEYIPYIQQPLRLTSDNVPGIRYCTDRLTAFDSSAVSDTALLSMHCTLTDLLTPVTQYLTESQQNSVVSRPVLAMHDLILHHSDGTFSLQYFEDTYRISRQQLCREYREAYGIPPLRDFNQHRLEHAKKMLLTSDLSIQDISSMVGFENSNHFHSLFQKYTGLTPGKFRQAGREGRL